MPTRRPTGSSLCPKIRFAFTNHPITVRAEATLLRLCSQLIELRVLEPIVKRHELIAQRIHVRKPRHPF